ncbi:sigma-70 family RNA polymerase sigma factor [Microbacterium sp. C5A9]|uniref:sigma-70 family RNA polymerase sigma factor n=1 Tax=Microbacterium sp. C5A9 TaxID=2736663 RepID=UPI001F5228C2|nr:sigma-70 family RNA polymerase sigma factor [Microbacterium sp. C5A9]MCI1018273.1 sigma-70 family RNA polymerase sigma factor [Microbacterium sp. C5A9]
MNQRTRNQLVVDHLHIVGSATADVASRLTHVSRDDLASAGSLALIRAADSFDPTLGVPFGAYATRRVRWALRDELRAMDWAPRDIRARARQTTRVRETLGASLGRTPLASEIAAAMGIEPSEVRESLADAELLTITSLDAGEANQVVWPGFLPDELAISAERDDLLHRAVDALPERRRYIVRAIYFEDRTVGELAEELGVSHAAISQQRAEGVRMLRDALERHYADDRRSPAPPASRSAGPTLDAYLSRIAAGGRSLTRALVPQPLGV